MARHTIELLLEKGVIGRKVTIIGSKNPDAIGASGIAVDETRNMITIETGKGHKRFDKVQHTFLVSLEETEVTLEGIHLVGRPEERIKKWLRKQSRLTKTLGLR